jgi:hypothetical protein
MAQYCVLLQVNFSEESLRENIGAFVNALLLAKPVGLKKSKWSAGRVYMLIHKVILLNLLTSRNSLMAHLLILRDKVMILLLQRGLMMFHDKLTGCNKFGCFSFKAGNRSSIPPSYYE